MAGGTEYEHGGTRPQAGDTDPGSAGVGDPSLDSGGVRLRLLFDNML
jgi:hypothetical protein